MEYFRINYNRLENLKQICFYKILLIFILAIVILLFVLIFKTAYHQVSFPSIYKDGVLIIKINNKLSDILKNNKYIIFNNEKTTYEIVEFNEYEIIDNEIYQNVILTIESEKFKNNEVGVSKLYYDKKALIKHIFELFK